MLFAAAKTLNTIATVYTDHTCSIRILNCLYFLNMTLKASQIDCRPLNNPIPAAKHRKDASAFFQQAAGQPVTGDLVSYQMTVGLLA